ncbi:Toxin-antitoxin biofilm protein TabA [termite gut metagenome]|jgi:YhcH/YjgK/YiaL family protein|uniref:Toxin-antitoxin biofilm protein TabA n=1 Tax=termite gut metagenome TaxID=433724 RepID=A0A5J4RN67_9ZZZZ
MIIDTLGNLEKYVLLNPLFKEAIEFIQTHDLNAMELGKTELKGKDLIISIAQTTPKTNEEAKLETHNEFIDIQIPLSGVEVMGYTPKKACTPADAPYNAEKDIAFFNGLAESYLTVKPGMFAVFFPQDGHAPGISASGVKKAIIKVRV